MTAIGPSRPEPVLENLTPAGARPAGTPHERSLADILSLTDARRFIPETLGLLALIVLAQSWLTQGAAGMPHPFWIPVLLMSCQYGIMGGLFATLAASAAFLAAELPPQSAAQDFYDYAAIVAAEPCGWFVSALVLGGLRTLHMHHQADLQERFERMSETAADLADGLERAAGEVVRLEHRIATDSSTLGALLHSLAKLDMRDRRGLLNSLSDLIRFGVGATGFAIYLKGAREFEPCVGVVDGAAVGAAATLPLLKAVLIDADTGGDRPAPADHANDAHAPLWAAVRSADGEAIGIVVCSRLHPSQSRAIARRRLTAICQLLAALLPACPAPAR